MLENIIWAISLTCAVLFFSRNWYASWTVICSLNTAFILVWYFGSVGGTVTTVLKIKRCATAERWLWWINEFLFVARPFRKRRLNGVQIALAKVSISEAQNGTSLEDRRYDLLNFQHCEYFCDYLRNGHVLVNSVVANGVPSLRHVHAHPDIGHHTLDSEAILQNVLLWYYERSVIGVFFFFLITIGVKPKEENVVVFPSLIPRRPRSDWISPGVPIFPTEGFIFSPFPFIPFHTTTVGT